MNEGISLHIIHNAVPQPCLSFFRTVESTREQQSPRHRTEPFHSALHGAGNRRASGERWEWRGGHRCYRHPRRGIASHVTAVGFFFVFACPLNFSRDRPIIWEMSLSSHRCAHPRSSGSSQRNFTQSLTTCWHALPPLWVKKKMMSGVEKLLIYWLIFLHLCMFSICRHPDHSNRPEHQLPPRVCR